jgi:hypothetical protein
MQNNFFNKNYNSALITLVLASIIIALGSYTYLTLTKVDEDGEAHPTIVVPGKGEVTAKPDIAQFSFSVEAEGADAATAQEMSGTVINKIMSYLKDSGIEEKDIKTQNYSLYPKYKFEPRTCTTIGYCPPGDRIADGFSVSQTIIVKVRAIDTASSLLAGVGEKGATNISSLEFTIDDVDVLTAEARQLAIEDAKKQAKQLAKDLGVSLGRLVGYSENGNSPTPYYSSPMMAEASTKDTFSGPDLPTGENNITSNVNLTFELE